MAHFRLEAAYDDATDLYYVEVFYPAQSETPLYRTRPRFRTREDGFTEAMRLMEEGLNQPVKELKAN